VVSPLVFQYVVIKVLIIVLTGTDINDHVVGAMLFLKKI
jgi:hypothetical protein